MAMGACPGQIPMPCVPPALMVTATMVRACRYILPGNHEKAERELGSLKDLYFNKHCKGSKLPA